MVLYMMMLGVVQKIFEDYNVVQVVVEGLGGVGLRVGYVHRPSILGGALEADKGEGV